MRRIGGKKFFNFDGKKYEVSDPNEFLIKLFSMKKRFYPRKWVKLFTIVLVGSMGSGKSTAFNKIINIIKEIYGDELNVIKTTDPNYAIEKAVDLHYFQCLIIDDAITAGLDSRRSMSNDNISLSQNYFLARHHAKKRMGKGILFVIFAIQSPTRLDKSIRENADLTIYKNYYPFLDTILEKDDLEYVKSFTRKAMLENEIDQLRYCLGIDRTNRPIRFEFPEENPNFSVLEIEKEPENYENLISEISRFYDEECKESVLKAFILHWCIENHKEISDSEIKQIIYKVIYEFNFGHFHRRDPDLILEKQKLTERIIKMRDEGLSHRKIAYILDMNPTKIFNLEKDWKKQQKRNERQRKIINNIE